MPTVHCSGDYFLVFEKSLHIRGGLKDPLATLDKMIRSNIFTLEVGEPEFFSYYNFSDQMVVPFEKDSKTYYLFAEEIDVVSQNAPDYGHKRIVLMPGTPMRKEQPHNSLRTPHCAQPRALQKGDMLANGDEILSDPRTGYNSSVLLRLPGGYYGAWIEVAPRIPIVLAV
jgi:hypothetical protein